MTGRALVFSNPQVIEKLKSSFVAYAGDKWYLQRQQDEEGRFFHELAQQRVKDKGLPKDASAQGIYVTTPDGKLLGSDHFHPSPERMLTLLSDSFSGWTQQPKSTTIKIQDQADENYRRTPPAGGLILDVFTRIPQKASFGAKWTPNHATGRDHLWITRDEWRSMLPQEWKTGTRVPLLKAVAERMIRFHLVDNVRGEPNMWSRDEIRESDLTLTVSDAKTGRMTLTGTVKVQHGEERGYHARLQGALTYDRKLDRLTRFDLLSWGEAWGEGDYTKGAPPGKFPLVIAFRLAGNTPADRVPPQGIRDRWEYFRATKDP